jgi:hypothetical protein
LTINAKGGQSFKPKAKGPHHHQIFKLCFKIFIGIFQIGMCYLQLVSIKTLLKTKRRISNSRGVLFNVKGKAFETGGEISMQSYSYTFDYLQKTLKKNFQNDLQKQNKWCKSGPKC